MADKTFHSLTLPGTDPARVPDVAAEFNTGTSYAIRDYCTYQGILYRCTTAHTGVWKATDFQATNLDNEFDDKLKIPPFQASAPANPRVGDLWIDNDEDSPILSIDPAPIAGSTNAVQSGGVRTLIDAVDVQKASRYLLTGDYSTSATYEKGQLVFWYPETFSTSHSYVVGESCVHNGVVYKCITAHKGVWKAADFEAQHNASTDTLYRCIEDIKVPESWTAAHWQATNINTELNKLLESEADTDMIAENYGDSSSYAVGDYVVHNSDLFKCVSAVSDTGSWDPDDWTQVKLANDVSDLSYQLNGTQKPLTNFFQRSGENRIWYREGRLINGYINITNQDYDITPYYTNYLATDWTKSLTIDNTSSYLGIAIRKSDKSDISGLTQEQLTALVSYETVLNQQLNEIQKLTMDGAINIPLTYFFQRSGENRIWYSEGRFINGYNISITNQDYDITPYYTDYFATDWTKSFTVDNASSYLGIAIRKSDKSDISGLTQEQLTALVNYGIETVLNKEITNLNKEIINLNKEIINLNKKIIKSTSTKFVHISFDDCVFWTDLIDNAATYTSAFDNSFLGYLRSLHDDYGAIFTLNCFCTSGNYSIENVPSKFASDFSSNKHWLRFAFHAEDSASNYSTDAVDTIKASYNKFTSAIYTMTNDVECIDRVTRLGFFTGSLNNIIGIRDVPTGIVGLLTADDTRTSYYLNNTNNAYIINHAKMYDDTNHIMFLHSQKRLESTTLANMESWLNEFLTVSKGNFTNYLELFTHEYEWNPTMLNKMEVCFQWLNTNGYVFTFMQDLLNL